MKNIIKNTNKKGFTIVELVIVIAVIAILAGVLIPTFSSIITKANESAAKQEATNAYKEIYAADLTDGKIDGMFNGETFIQTAATDGNVVNFSKLGITYKGAVTEYEFDTAGKLTAFVYTTGGYTFTLNVSKGSLEVTSPSGN